MRRAKEMPSAKRNKTGEKTSPIEFAQTLHESLLAVDGENWITAPSLSLPDLKFEPDVFLSVSSHLLSNPNLISPVLFRADILYDSNNILGAVRDENSCLRQPDDEKARQNELHSVALGCSSHLNSIFTGFELKRVVVRKLIPRNPNIDPSHDQTYRLYQRIESSNNTLRDSLLAVYLPHAASEQDIPFYHPVLRGFALIYTYDNETRNGTLSLHILPFASGIPGTIPNRLHRTLLNLLSVHVRLASGSDSTSRSANPSLRPLKDNLVSQNVFQNTYTKLKSKYAPSLVKNWVEVTEPSKHVFEDLLIAAFLIELWKTMYRLPPLSSVVIEDESIDVLKRGPPSKRAGFPGFVDIACGNGVLVYILLAEGYEGWGFDARARKSWSIYPLWVQEQLKERVCVPGPFKVALSTESSEISDSTTISGQFKAGTFIVSNHADELTLWTPLLGALSHPSQPLPFLAIPCCSHGLSGARYRYPPPKDTLKSAHKKALEEHAKDGDKAHDTPKCGDLRALRLKKLEAQQNPGSSSSAYGCLTAKLVHISEEVGYVVDKTLLRIPSTRNIGVIGGLRAWQATTANEQANQAIDVEEQNRKIMTVVERETKRDAGLAAAAKVWVERSMALRKFQGKRTLNIDKDGHHD